MTSSFVPPTSQPIRRAQSTTTSAPKRVTDKKAPKRKVHDWNKVVQDFYLHLSSSPATESTFTNDNSNSKYAKGKSRSKEFTSLAKKLNIEKKDLKKLLVKQRSIVKDEEKALYIDWLLDTSDSLTAKNDLKNDAMDVDKKDDSIGRNNDNNNGKSTKNKKRKNNSKNTKEDTVASTASFAKKDAKKVKEETEGATTTTEKKKQPSFLTNESFANHKNIHPSSKRALTEVLNLQSMTEIQSKTFAAAASGSDVLGRARTGTGKTLAFLVPALEHLLQSTTYIPGKTVGVLVISPTRELATQIGDQAEKLLTYHRNMNVQVVFGGTNMKRDVTAFQKRLPTILVATPGRLLDHLQSTSISSNDNRRPLQFGKDIMCHTPSVVLDETDRLLDMGFRNEINKILNYLPISTQRQTLLFSATIPDDLKDIMAQTMKDDYIEVDCINDGDDTGHTHVKIQQSHVIVPTTDRYMSSLVEVVRMAMKQEEAPKIVVFFVTARMVQFYAEMFNEALNIPVIELHSKKSQSYRNRASEEFRSADSAILFTSDVSARGVDYPGVTQVIQFGLPMNREQYIHRLGRTGRAGKDGKGWLVLGSFESLFLQELKDLDIPRNKELENLFCESMDTNVEGDVEVARKKIQGTKKLRSSAQGAYQAFLGFYLGQLKRIKMKRKEDLVDIANDFSRQMGLKEVPGLTKQMVGKMGLKGVQGIVMKSKEEEADMRGGGRGGQNQRGRGAHRHGSSSSSSSASPGRKRGHSDGRRGANSGRRTRRG